MEYQKRVVPKKMKIIIATVLLVGLVLMLIFLFLLYILETGWYPFKNIMETDRYLDYVEWNYPFRLVYYTYETYPLELVGKNQEKHENYYIFNDEIPKDKWIVIRVFKGFTSEWKICYNPQTVSEPDTYFKPVRTEVFLSNSEKVEFENLEYVNQVYQKLWDVKPTSCTEWLSENGYEDQGTKITSIRVFLEKTGTICVAFDYYEVEKNQKYYWASGDQYFWDLNCEFINTDEWQEILQEYPFAESGFS